MSNYDAVDLGYVSLLKDRRSRGLLKSYERTFVCAAAARSGDLAELKALRAANFPWDSYTCARAARGGHLETLQWLRANFFWLPAGRRRVRARNRAYFLV